MTHIKPSTAGLVLGAFFGAVHLVWSVLVFLGWAQPLLDFIFMLHMITPVLTVEAFSWTSALTLIVLVAIIGYVVGSILAVIWNKMHQAEARALH